MSQLIVRSTDQEAARQKRIAAAIADGITIQDRFKAEPLLKNWKL